MRWFLVVSVLATGCSAAAYGDSDDGDTKATSATKNGDPADGAEEDDEPSVGDDGVTTTSVPTCDLDLNPELKKLNVPGMSVGLLKNGKLACTAVAGYASIEELKPITPETVFLWASVSKTVTAVTFMTVVEEKKLDLDGSINDSLPFKVAIPKCTATPTYRQLLTHTSSIMEDEDEGAYADSYVQGDAPTPLADFMKSFLVPGGALYDASSNFTGGCPGTTNEYSNVGAAMIGYLAERITNTPFDQLAKERVFEPLGMTEASFRLKDLDLSHLATPYEIEDGKFKSAGQFGFPTYPDGLLRTSVPQMARFLGMFAQFGELDGTRILTKSTVEEMRRVQIADLDDTQGLIWYYEDFGKHKNVLGHNGSDPGVSSNMYFDPADGSGVLLVTNGEWHEAGADALMETLFDAAKAL